MDGIDNSLLLNIDDPNRANAPRALKSGGVPGCTSDDCFHTFGDKQLKAQ